MLSFFPEPYPGELIYSTIARYHLYSGNLDCKDTLEEVFQKRTVIPSVEIGSHLNILAQQMGPHFSMENLLGNHTIYSFYALFLSCEKRQQILKDVQKDGKGLYARLGMLAGSICRKDGLYYCPQCAVNDIDQYGEPYIHREHQLQGIDVCPHHQLLLKKYPINPSVQSRIAFIRFEAKRMNLSFLQSTEPYFYDLQVMLAKMSYKLLQVNINQISREKIAKKYRLLLRERGLITTSNHVRQNDLYQMFISKFPIGFLEKYESALDMDNEYNWLRVITRNTKRHVHPFRHLLFLYFLEKDIEEFFKDVKEDHGPFGSGPWPCLNKAAAHYKEHIIQEVSVTRDFKSKFPIGTFSCSCGFVYVRKGPDTSLKNIYRIGRTKVFGEVWQAKLKQLKGDGTYNAREIGRILGVDSKTIKKFLETSIETSNPSKTNGYSQRLQQYRQQLLEGLKEYSDYTRTQIRNLFSKEYSYLYRNDKEWLFDNLPQKQSRVMPTGHVDWEARDKEYLSKIKALYRQLIVKDKPVRITISLIGKQTGILSNLEKRLDKLPKTARYLEEITESTQEFQFRRCCKIIELFLHKGEPVLLWKVQRIGAVKSYHFQEIKPLLEKYLRARQAVDNYKQTTS
ncbi:TnsD family Tn7-like transposition protein [Domibacillus enclensis]|uniref:TniQ protein n=1 Tax=Domibacillus enclensis TaxID=1017273 RepID=A0A1N7AHP8_9BACI|nr:TnsD family Tn7-like transposition protein [Domibacillus enclensis]OXS75822.1 transposase [Domibacillus enclensis]SIR38491.1 TniQ protein [Domibacillus enclensis]